ncbi:MAG: beta strand repeat-containing protein, partial [Mycobacterium sp.]
MTAKAQEYQTYWQFRNEQPDPSVFDPNFLVVLTPAQLAYYQSAPLNYSPAEILSLENANTAEYHVLEAQYSQFDSPIVNSASNTIFLGNASGLQTGDQVTYDSLGNTAIGGLTSGSQYFVYALGDGSVRLYGSEADALAGGAGAMVLGSGANGTQQQFAFSPSIHFDPGSQGVVNTATGSIYLGPNSGLATGDQVSYDAEPGNSAIGGLTSGAQYFVNVQDGGSVRLYLNQTDANSSAADFIVLTSTGSGSDQKFVTVPAVQSVATFNPTGTTIQRDAIVNTSDGSASLANSIVVGMASGLQTGDAVTYDAEANSAIGGLTSGDTYYVNLQGNGTIKLYDTEADAIADSGAGNGNFVALSSIGSGTEQKLTFSLSIHFNPTAPSVVDTGSSTIFLPAGNGLSTGDAVTYDAEPGNSAIGGLTSGDTYYVNVQHDGTFRLYANQSDANGNAADYIVLTSTGSGSDQKFVTAGTTTVKFNPTGTTNFIYTPTQGEVNTLTAGIKEWTPDQLLYGISQGLMSNVTDTIPVVKDPDILTQGNVTLLTHGSVGENSGSVLIALPPPASGFSTDELLALATAERTDVQFLGAAPIDATVNFSGTTITRTDGGNWNGLSVGMYVTIDGNNGNVTRNATDSNVFDQITAISQDGSGRWVLTVNVGLTSENAKQILVAPIVLDPTFEALPLAGQSTPALKSASVHFVANGFDATTGNPVPGQIVRDGGGSWLADGFQVGDLLQIGSSPSNSTGAGLVYKISAVTAGTITLTNGDVIFNEATETISIGRGRAPAVSDIKVSQVSPFKVNAGGQINVSAGKSVYLDSDQTIRIVQVIAGTTENYGDNVRIATIGQTAESILNAQSGNSNLTSANIEGQNLVLEAATGTIGGSGGVDPITLDLVADGTLTARAQGDVNIYSIAGNLPSDNGGSMYLQSVFSAGGDAYLTADNSILDPFDNVSTIGKAVQINANHIYLDAINGSIGSVYDGQPDFIGIEAAQTFAGSIDATAHGNIYLFETSLNLYVHQILSQAGDVDLQAQLSIYDQATAGPGNVVTDIPTTDIFGNNITLTALLGGIGLAGDPLDIYSHYAYDRGTSRTIGTLTASATADLGLNVYIIQNDNVQSPNAPDPDNLYLNTVTTGPNEVAFLTAPLGSILNGNSGGENVLGGNTLLFARDDIGTQANRIATQVGNLEGQSTTGSTWIDNNGDLSIGGVLISSDPIGVFSGGDATITAASPVVVNKSISSGGSINIIAKDDSTGDNITVEALDLLGNALFL